MSDAPLTNDQFCEGQCVVYSHSLDGWHWSDESAVVVKQTSATRVTIRINGRAGNKSVSVRSLTYCECQKCQSK